ncbi:MAG: hypothetical protein AB1391_03520 [Candidatus Micrarchaeota archaeon]
MNTIREMKQDALEKKIEELTMELMIAGKTQNNKVRAIKLSIARIKTYLSELKRLAKGES